MSTTSLLRRFVAILFAGVVALTIAACGSDDGGSGSTGGSTSGEAAAKEIKILVPAPLSGDYAETGEKMVRGAEYAAEYLNGLGGVQSGPLKGAKFVIESADDGASTKGAASIASRFVQDDSYFALDGHSVTGLSAAAASVLERAGLPLIAGYSGGDPLTDDYDNVLPLVARLPAAGYATADFAHRLGAKRIATIAVDASYVDGYYPGIERAAADDGMEYVEKLIFPGDTTNFAPFVTSLKRANVDAILVGSDNEAAVGRIVTQIRRAGMDVPIIDFVGIGLGETYLKAAGDNAIGTYILDASLVYGAMPEDPEAAKFYEEMTRGFEERYGRSMGSAELHMFDSVLTIEKLISSGATKREDLIRNASQISGEGLTGPIDYSDEPRPRVRYATITKILSVDPEEREVAAVYAFRRDDAELLSGGNG